MFKRKSKKNNFNNEKLQKYLQKSNTLPRRVSNYKNELTYLLNKINTFENNLRVYNLLRQFI